ncbi:MAG TPA: DUF3237 domain-containing protein [Polyangiales bacterium]|nr:DUF3237 domain-containing protein [Polyangiales bacterium]
MFGTVRYWAGAVMVVTLHSMISFPVSSRRSVSLALTALMPLIAAFAGCSGSGDAVSGGPIVGAAAGSGGTPAAGQTAAADGGNGAAAAGTTATTGAAGTTTTKPPGAAGSTSSAAGASGAAGAGAAAGAPAATGGAPANPTAGAGGIAGAAGLTATPMAGSGGSQPPALTDADTLIPHASWDCGMPAGIPGPGSGELAFEATLTLGEVYDLGDTQFGKRLLIEVKGGTLKGPEIEATFMDRGLDWQLTLPNGAVEVEQVNILQTSDGTNIYFRNCGTAAGPGDVRIVPDIEAPTSSRYAWLNTTKLAGTRTFDAATKKLTMRVFKLAAQSAGGAMLKVEEPMGLPDQTWECKKPMGRQAGVVYTESVGIDGGSVSVGASKRGSRNIVPITGGTTEGRIEGGVLSGGADFQLSAGGEFILDARYTLKTKEGELIIVRNCGPIGALVPVFEAKASGPYGWVNANTWLSSDPGIGPGVVNLTIYETN